MKDIKNYGIVISLIIFVASFVVHFGYHDYGSLMFGLVASLFFCVLIYMKAKYEKKVEPEDASKQALASLVKRVETLEFKTGFESKGWMK